MNAEEKFGCLIFLWKPWSFFRIIWWIEGAEEQHIFEMEIFYNVFTVTFDQFNASLQHKILY